MYSNCTCFNCIKITNKNFYRFSYFLPVVTQLISFFYFYIFFE